MPLPFHVAQLRHLYTHLQRLHLRSYADGLLAPAIEELEKVQEMRLCEQSRVFLKPDTHYVFTVDPKCRHCREAAERAGVTCEAVMDDAIDDHLIRPTGDMMDAARHLLVWLSFPRPTERELLRHCERLRIAPPKSCRDVDHVPPKRQMAFWIFQAMMKARPKPEDLTSEQELRDIEERLNAWLIDNTDEVFEEEPEVDGARSQLLERIERM